MKLVGYFFFAIAGFVFLFGGFGFLIMGIWDLLHTDNLTIGQFFGDMFMIFCKDMLAFLLALFFGVLGTIFVGHSSFTRCK